jgi:hypothetical protein
MGFDPVCNSVALADCRVGKLPFDNTNLIMTEKCGGYGYGGCAYCCSNYCDSTYACYRWVWCRWRWCRFAGFSHLDNGSLLT